MPLSYGYINLLQYLTGYLFQFYWVLFYILFINREIIISKFSFCCFFLVAVPIVLRSFLNMSLCGYCGVGRLSSVHIHQYACTHVIILTWRRSRQCGLFSTLIRSRINVAIGSIIIRRQTIFQWIKWLLLWRSMNHQRTSKCGRNNSNTHNIGLKYFILILSIIELFTVNLVYIIQSHYQFIPTKFIRALFQSELIWIHIMNKCLLIFTIYFINFFLCNSHEIAFEW